MLKSKIETAHFVDVADLADFLKLQYNLDETPELENMDDFDNVKVYDVCVSELREWDLAKIEKFIKTGHESWSIGVLLIDQCNWGFLAPGKYVVEF